MVKELITIAIFCSYIGCSKDNYYTYVIFELTMFFQY